MKLILTSALFLVTSCTTVPRDELSGYLDSFRSAQAAATPIIAEYSVAERNDRRGKLRSSDRFASGYFDTFEVSDAPAVTSIGMPPAAEQLDRAMRSIASYNETLVYLAENKNIDEARAQLKSITDNLAGLPIGITPLGPAANALATALAPAIQQRNKREFRAIVLNGHPQVVKLIEAMRDYTPNQFDAITAPLRRRADRAAPEARQEIRDKINKWHALFGDYVVLLNAMQKKLDSLHEVALHPRREALLVRADRSAAELRVYADSLQRAIVELHAGQ